ncbi:MAG: hypothetical protein ACEY3H_07175 [Wolbachia sp.]
MNDNNNKHYVMRGMKHQVNKAIENILSQVETQKFKQIVELLMKISHSARSRIQDDNLD